MSKKARLRLMSIVVFAVAVMSAGSLAICQDEGV